MTKRSGFRARRKSAAALLAIAELERVKARVTARYAAEAAELCRCWHRQDQHGDDGCTSPTVVVWGDGTTAPTPCGCERFRQPDSDE